MSLCERLSKVDTFAAPVNINYRGKESFRSGIGGLVTIIIYLFTIYWLLMQTTSLFNKDNSVVQSYDVIDVDGVKKDHGLAEMKGGFSFLLDRDFADFTRHSVRSVDPRYGQIQVTTVEVDRTNGFKHDQKQYSLAPCTEDSLATQDIPKDQIGDVMEESFTAPELCIVDEDRITFAGLVTTRKVKLLQVLVQGCVQEDLEEGVTCATEEEQDQYMHGLVFIARVKTNYVVFEDMDKPVHSYLYQAIRHSLDANNIFSKQLKIDRNYPDPIYHFKCQVMVYARSQCCYFESQDNIFQVFNGPQKIEFFSYKDKMVESSAVKIGPKRYLELTITLGEQKSILKRQVYSIMEFLEDLGGFFGVMYTFGVIANFLFACKDPQLQYLSHFYEDRSSNRKSGKVKPGTDTRSMSAFEKKRWLRKSKKFNPSLFERVMRSWSSNYQASII